MVLPTEPLLFRYSALTFNSHRIHYDLPYARDVERYRALVVHGPLTSTLLLALAQRELGDNALKSFAFRGLSPAMCGEALHLAMRGRRRALNLAPLPPMAGKSPAPAPRSDRQASSGSVARPSSGIETERRPLKSVRTTISPLRS
ncbi:hypothetical protein [Novosphingobium sp.]|uniref:hypothetical protein n=1 Tax=Novosphingobium sp. TaxID=1874826 RepID=UPI003423F6B0